MRTSARAVAKAREDVSRVDALGRRYLSVEKKQQIVAEALAANVSVAEVARRHEGVTARSQGDEGALTIQIAPSVRIYLACRPVDSARRGGA
jgi:hypothetical protein